jgi:hypothetical protein
MNFSPFCLSYLFSNKKFADNTLGVAYVGGVCAKYGLVKDQKSGVTERRSTNAGFIAVHDPKKTKGIMESRFMKEN